MILVAAVLLAQAVPPAKDQRPGSWNVPHNVRCVADSFGGFTCSDGSRVIRDSFGNVTVSPPRK
jgi:hypothetical protein